MISDEPYLFTGREGTKRKHNDFNNSTDDDDDDDDDELTLAPKRQKLNNFSLDISNQEIQAFSANTAPGTDQNESTSYTSLYGPLDNERYLSRQSQVDAIADDDAYWHLADHYYETPSDEDDVNVNDDDDDDDDNVDESDVDESDEDCDVSHSDYDGDDEISDSDTEDNNERNDDDDDDDDEYEVDNEDDGMTEEEIGLLLYVIFSDNYTLSPYAAEE
ncbi:nucleolar transcription factor 1-B-like [Pecten maximus]|uniref:nucleolar transcription factor 1-B-like n=1 Tax=Pecten maximus TaxID=6579 RepID=UPI001458F3B1|nr:nucleolar transcription factor 1-B-like [Pecten maximus]